MCQTLKIAPGSVASGLVAKFAVAKGNGKSAVLHSDFNCDCCCLGIFNMKYFCCQKAKSHTAQIVDRHNNQYKHTAAYNFFCIDGHNSGNDHHDRYNGDQRQHF